MKFYLNSLFVLPLFVLFIACSDDDDSNNPPPQQTDQQGSSSFTVAGDQEGEHSGIADFRAFEMNGIHTWDITLQDHSPMNFNISFMQTGSEPISAPGVGTYDLAASLAEDAYITTYDHYDDNPLQGMNYTVGLAGTSGVMEITSSSDNLIEGNFSFTAALLDDDGNARTIEVTDGVFSAVPRP